MVSLWMLTGFWLWVTQTDERHKTKNTTDTFNLQPQAGFPLRSCNYGYYKKRRHVTNYNLRRRISRRQQDRPKRNEAFSWWDPMTWKWPGTPQIPVPRERQRQSQTKRTKRSKRERSLKSRKRRRQPSRNKHNNNKAWSHTFCEAEQRQKSDYAQLKHRLLHQSWLMYDMQFGVSLDNLIGDTDPARQWRMIKQLHALTKGERQPLPMVLKPTIPFGCIALAKWLREDTVGPTTTT
jgi:hypothetical protein